MARPEAAAAHPSTGSLRLTRRGRVVIAAAAALLVAALSMIAAAAAQATSHSVAQPTARQDLVQVVVRSGESLWTVAQSTDPNADPRQVIQRIIDLNGLTGDLVQPGQQLWVPRS
jgi:ABC-type sugar transport system substrate-binding protein